MTATVVPILLERDNYEDWSLRVETYLLADDLWDVIETTDEPPTLEDGEVKFKAWRRSNAKALHIIQNSCSDDTYSFIKGIRSAKAAWDTLAKKFKPVTKGTDWGEDSDLDANETPTKVGTRSKKHSEIVEEDADQKKIEVKEDEGHASDYDDIFRLLKDENWDAVKKFLIQHPDAVRARHPPIDEGTPLHYAVLAGKLRLVKKLLRFMTDDDVEIRDSCGRTALSIFTMSFIYDSDEMVEIAKCLVEKNKKIVSMAFKFLSDSEWIPLIVALDLGKWNLARYLSSVTPLASQTSSEDKHVDKISEEKPDVDIATCHTRSDGDDGKNVDLETQRVVEERDHTNIAVANDFELEPFFNNLRSNNWVAAMEFLDEHPEAAKQTTVYTKETALHVAVRVGNVRVVTKLLQKMEEKDLKRRDCWGRTALGVCCAFSVDSETTVEIAKCLVEKNQELLYIVHCNTNRIPLVEALAGKKPKLAHYLYTVSPVTQLESLTYFQVASLICNCCFVDKHFDAVTLDLIRRYPSLAIIEVEGQSPLTVLASMRSAFLSGTQLTWLQRLIYKGITIKSISDTRDFSKSEGHQDNQRHPFHSVVGYLRGPVVRNLLKYLGATHIYQIKLVHVRVEEYLNSMCCAIEKTEFFRPIPNNVESAIFQAIERGQFEFVTDHIYKANKEALKHIYDSGIDRTVFQFAVECRQENVYNLIHGYSAEEKEKIVHKKDKSNNNLLHLGGMVSSKARIDHIRGAALQMQREVQWFKELLESLAPVSAIDSLNSDHMSPQELFVKEHKELVKKGEESMKETATSCTVVGALIVTMMFAAAFTVPGGNNGNTGVPNFIDEKIFMVFMVSDAISLCLSTTSVIMFLGILTSRYAVDDFHKALPRKMILGLSTLFLSITAMMIAFSCALILMLQEKSWIVIPAILLGAIPITSFGWMQFAFLGEIFISTYGPGIFERKLEGVDQEVPN